MIALPAIVALALLQDASGLPVALHENGFCAGESWITLQPGEKVTMDRGPDFGVYRVTGPGESWWGVYAGMAGQGSPDRPLLRKDGATVYRATERGDDGKRVFGGYFVGRKYGQNHFFGNVFKDAPADRAFFARVRLGRIAERLCAAARGKEVR